MKVYELIFPEHVDVDALKVLNEDGDEIGIDLSGIDESEVERHEVDARRLRPHRGADREAGHPAAHPRGRARSHVRRVRRPRRRHRHRHRAAERLALHARRPRPCRGPAAQERADRDRALRPRGAHQGHDRQGAELDQGPAGDPLAAQRRARAQAVRARGPRDRRRSRRDPQRRPRDRAIAARSPSSRTPTVSTRSAPASARAVRVCAWWSANCAASASTSCPTTTSRHVSSPRRSRRRACARCSSTTKARRRRSSCPTTSSRWRSAKRARTPAWRASSPGWRIDIKSQTEMAEAEEEHGLRQRRRDLTGRCIALTGGGKRCPNMALPGTRYCGIPADYVAERRRDRDAPDWAEQPTAEDATASRARRRGRRGVRRGGSAAVPCVRVSPVGAREPHSGSCACEARPGAPGVDDRRADGRGAYLCPDDGMSSTRGDAARLRARPPRSRRRGRRRVPRAFLSTPARRGKVVS